MRLSTKGRHAVTAMMELAIREKHGLVTLADVSHDQGISLSYLEQLFAHLRRGGLVEGVRGPGGGYRLARPADAITIADIVSAVDETPGTVRRSAGEENFHDTERGLTQELWNGLSKQIYDFLNRITLARFLERPEIQELIQGWHTPASESLQHKRSVA